MLPSLPDDVIFEILSWVPVKPACRFRCVSRGWCTLISNPTFLAAHKSRTDPLLLSVTTTLPPNVSSVVSLMNIDGNLVRATKNVSLWAINNGFNGHVCVCFTRNYVTVVDLATGNVVKTSAELDHILVLYNLVVGCAVPSRTYKVVCLTSKDEPCKVLTLEDGAKWRQVHSPPTPPLATNGFNHGSPVTVNGVMHFLNKFAILHADEDYVLRFDLESEEWRDSIKGPRRIGDKLQENKCMVKLNDALCMVHWRSKNECLIWVLTDSDKDTWVMEYIIPVAPTIDSLRPLTVMRDGRKLLFYASNRFKETSTLQVYDPLAGTCTDLIKSESNILGNPGLCVLHLENFVSPTILPTQSVFSQLISCQWLRRLNPLSLFYR